MPSSSMTPTTKKSAEAQPLASRNAPDSAFRFQQLDTQPKFTPDNASSASASLQNAEEPKSTDGTAPDTSDVCNKSIHSRSLSSITSASAQASLREDPSSPFSWANFLVVQYHELLPAAKKYFWFYNSIKVLTVLGSIVALAVADTLTCDRPFLTLILLHYALIVLSFPCDLVIFLMGSGDNTREAAQLSGLSLPPRRIHRCMGWLRKLCRYIEVAFLVVDNYMLFTQITCKHTSPSLYAAMWIWVVRGYVGIAFPLLLYGCCWSCMYAADRSIESSALLIPLDPTKLSSLRLLRYCSAPVADAGSDQGLRGAKPLPTQSASTKSPQLGDSYTDRQPVNTIARTGDKQQQTTPTGAENKALDTANSAIVSQRKHYPLLNAKQTSLLSVGQPNATDATPGSPPTSIDKPFHRLGRSTKSPSRADFGSVPPYALRSMVDLGQYRKVQRTSKSTSMATLSLELATPLTRGGGAMSGPASACETSLKRSSDSNTLPIEYTSVVVHRADSIDLAASQVASVTTADSDSEDDDVGPLVPWNELQRSSTTSTHSLQDLPHNEAHSNTERWGRQFGFLLNAFRLLGLILNTFLKWFESKTPLVEPDLEQILFDNAEDAKCFICFTDYHDGDILREFPCNHYFHQTCADRWLSIGKCCPLCKADVAKTLKSKASKERKPAPAKPLSTTLRSHPIRIADAPAPIDQLRFRRIVKEFYDWYAQVPMLFDKLVFATDDHPTLGSYFTCSDGEDQFIFTSCGVIYQVKFIDRNPPAPPFNSLIPVRGDVTERVTGHYYSYIAHMLLRRSGHDHPGDVSPSLDHGPLVNEVVSEFQSKARHALTKSAVSLPTDPRHG